MESTGPDGVAGATVDPPPALAALPARGPQRPGPMYLDYVEALARRAAAHEGEVRRLLEGRLATVTATATAKALSGCGQAYRGVASRRTGTSAAAPQAPVHGGPLADLLRHIARHSPAGRAGGSAVGAAGGGVRPVELKALSQFASTWSRLSVDRQLSQSLAKVPENAGPLNSHHLALRSLTLMRDISPDYLSRFMSYVDALSWLDRAAGGGTPAPARAAGSADKAGKARKANRRQPG